MQKFFKGKDLFLTFFLSSSKSMSKRLLLNDSFSKSMIVIKPDLWTFFGLRAEFDFEVSIGLQLSEA